MTQHLLLLCHANIARSAAAELIARSLVSGDWAVASAGTRALVGEPIDPVIGDAVRQRGIPVSSHRARQVTVDDVRGADLILAFERDQRSWVLEQCPAALRYTLTIRRAAEIARRHPLDALPALLADTRTYDTTDDFADPFGRGARVADAAVDEIDDLLRIVLPAIGATSALPPKAAPRPTRRSLRAAHPAGAR